MKRYFIKKICERCQRLFYIDGIRSSLAREKMIMYTPCTHCGFVRDPIYPASTKSGSCIGCKLAFVSVQHYAKGFCKRDYNNLPRNRGRKV